MIRLLAIYLVACIVLFAVSTALPVPDPADATAQPNLQEKTQSLDIDAKPKSALAIIRDCLKSGQFDISKGCRPQRVDKHAITIESPHVESPAPSGITSDVLDCLTADVLLS